MEIILDNRQDNIELDSSVLDKIKNVITECLSSEDRSDDCEISLSFVDNVEIRQLNNEFRNIDRETDVLSFPLLDKENEFEIAFEEVSLGDIVISLEKALEQSIEYNHSLEREICFLVCHSMFHLFGYDHDNDINTKKMREKEEKVLKKLNITRD